MTLDLMVVMTLNIKYRFKWRFILSYSLMGLINTLVDNILVCFYSCSTLGGKCLNIIGYCKHLSCSISFVYVAVVVWSQLSSKYQASDLNNEVDFLLEVNESTISFYKNGISIWMVIFINRCRSCIDVHHQWHYRIEEQDGLHEMLLKALQKDDHLDT